MAFLFVVFLIWVGVNFSLANFVTVRGVNRALESGSQYHAIENGATVLRENSEYRDYQRWAEDHGFEPVELIDFHRVPETRRVTLGIWYNPETKTVLYAREVAKKLGLFTAPSNSVLFTTDLDSTSQLLTADDRGIHVLPSAPGSYGQSFPGLDIGPLYEKHQEGLQHVVENLGRVAVDRHAPFYEAEHQDTIRQIAYIKSLPFWWLRGFHWQFVTRFTRSNKSVIRQYPASRAGAE